MKREKSQWWSAGFTREWWYAASDVERFDFLEELTDVEVEDFYKDWRVWGRDNQLMPEGIWTTWMLLMGRGTGKTRSAVEGIRDEVGAAKIGRIGLVGQGESDIREVMIEGESGFLATARNDFRPTWQPSVGQGRLTWPNGAQAFTYSIEDPEALRGPQFDFAWADEPMAYPAEKRQKGLSNLKFGLRLGRHPRLIYSTTPKPHRWLTDELAKVARYNHLPLHQRKYVLSRGSTLENRENLAETFFEGIMDDYDGTSLGRQEIYAEIIGTEEGALWTPELLQQQRLLCTETDDGSWPTQLLQAFVRECDKVIVAVDPNVTANAKTAHAAGIVVLAKRGRNIYVIDDRSVKGGPAVWAAATKQAVVHYDADEVVAEVNQGGEMVRMTLQTFGVDVPIRMVRATKGKQRRAEPIATAYERERIFHLQAVGTTDRPGPFFKLESQMCALHDAYDPTGEDFDRCDALVWGATRLGVKNKSLIVGAGFGGILTSREIQRYGQTD